jgi:hypothetical protein
MKHQINPEDILPAAEYEKVRAARRAAIRPVKLNRRIEIGPHATFYFENYDTMWLQIQEMLRIEKGGAAQLAEELEAYNPMVPNGRELTATLMFEIEDEARRRVILGGLGGVEKTVELRFGGEVVRAVPEQDLDYSTADGKASSVQFLHFPFTSGQVMKFRTSEVVIAITHPRYGHMAVVPDAVRAELVKDFD